MCPPPWPVPLPPWSLVTTTSQSSSAKVLRALHRGDRAADELVGPLDRCDVLGHRRMKAVGVPGHIDLADVEEQGVGIAFA